MSETKLELYFFFTVFIVALAVVGYIFLPFIGSLALALVLAVLGAPLYEFLYKSVKSETISALLVVLLMVCCVLVPASFLLILLLNEIQQVMGFIAYEAPFSSWSPLFSVFIHKLVGIFPFLASFDYTSVLQSFVQTVGTKVTAGLSGLLDAVLGFFVAIFSLFYFLKDGKRFVKKLIELSPLTNNEDVKIMQKIRLVSRSLIRGTFLVALLQGFLMGAGFFLFGLPNPVLWGTITAFCSLIPSVGTGIVAFPMFLYLLVTGHVFLSLLFFVWGIVFVGFVDNLVRPFLMGHDADMHPLLVLLSVLGGVVVFGVSGILIGPLFFGLLMAFTDIYLVKIQKLHTQKYESGV